MHLAISSAKYDTIKSLNKRFKHTPSAFPPNMLAWLGGSIVGSMNLKPDVFLQKDSYKEDTPCIPDWTVHIEPELQNVADDQTF